MKGAVLINCRRDNNHLDRLPGSSTPDNYPLGKVSEKILITTLECIIKNLGKTKKK